MAILDKITYNGTEYVVGNSIGGQPTPITQASQMTDTGTLYLYLGNETGYTYGYVYAYISGAWTKTALYGQGADGYSPSVSVANTSTGAIITATDKDGTTSASSITVGQGDNDLTYNNGAITKSGNTITVKPNLIVGDMWISVTTTANS